jgi:signal transduction histidine kinase
LEEIVVDGLVQRLKIQSASPDQAAGSNAQGDKEPSIPPGKRRVEFRYTGLSLSAPESVRFRYKLEGLDERWIEAGLERVASYSMLPAGSYRFNVTACNNSGIWNQQVASLSFHVLPFFWQTWWFRLALLAGLVVSLVAIVRYVSFRRLRRRLQILEQETAVQKDRARIAKDLHDDLGANLSQIAMLSELAQTDYEKPAQARGHIDQIFRTARTVTRSLDEIVWAVNPRNDSLDRFAAHLCTFAPEYLRAAGISCRLDVPLELPSTPLPSNVRHHLYLAFKEALHNVVKHAGATEVWLRLTLGEREVALVIEDNGRGFQSGNETSAGEDGLANLRQRMTEIGGRFEQRSQPGQGTRTALIAPLLLTHPRA